MPQKKLSQSLNEFVNVLVDEELEPIRLNLIRVENDLRAELDNVVEKAKNIAASVKEGYNKEKKDVVDFAEQKREVLAEIGEIIEARRKKTIDEIHKVVESKYEILKNAIENLATRASEAFAEGFSEQEEQFTEILDNLNNRISALERQLNFKAEEKSSTTTQQQTVQPKQDESTNIE